MGDARIRRRKAGRNPERHVAEFRRNIGEYPKLEAMLRQGYIRFEGKEHLQKDKGGFIIGAHLGNWEALAMIGPYLGLKTGLIYRPLNNPYGLFLLKKRARAAEADTYEKGREAAMGMISTVRKGGRYGDIGRPAIARRR